MSDRGQGEAARVATLLDLHRFDEACAVAGTVVASDPTNAVALRLLARAAIAAGRAVEAEAALDQAAALDPENGETFRLRTELLLAGRRGALALRAARRAVELEPNNSASHFVLLRAGIATKKTRIVSVAAVNVAELSPGSVLAHQAQGLASIQRRRWTEAESYFRAALALAPDSPSLVNNLALTRLHQGHTAEAAELFAEAGRLDPRNDTYLKNSAIAGHTHLMGGWWARLAGPGIRGPLLRVLFVFVVVGTIELAIAGPNWLGFLARAALLAALIRLFLRHRELSETSKNAMRIDAGARRRAEPKPRWRMLGLATIGLVVLTFVLLEVAVAISPK